jgi:hypothetical protein
MFGLSRKYSAFSSIHSPGGGPYLRIAAEAGSVETGVEPLRPIQASVRCDVCQMKEVIVTLSKRQLGGWGLKR